MQEKSQSSDFASSTGITADFMNRLPEYAVCV